ncbi:haloacid dehalogenase type II [Motiliproteus sediminis]|uniref:haloacid dehalogenase type II n=1 Tax=Motiliproteus sediminis TaxID=1468178 RepID=UPI001AEFD010|nr:haloacid dehalogenase type II [Motiliproteus sediminis]
MGQLLAFDVYGTLIDTQGVITALQTRIGDRAAAFSALWRDKQLEYSFRRGLMGRYRNFGVCTAQALDYCCELLQVDFDEQDKQALMACYATLPAFADAETGLQRLQAQGVRMVAFSNGTADAVAGLLAHAGIEHYFEDVVSVDEIGTFKPNPKVYQHLLTRCDQQASATWLISSNPFDVIGARAEGLRTVWVRRTPTAVFDAWEYAPERIVTELSALADALD